MSALAALLPAQHTSLNPTLFRKRFTLAGGEYDTLIIGGPNNWSFLQLANKNEAARKDYAERVGYILYDVMSAGKTYSFTPGFNAVLGNKENITDKIRAGRGIFYRNPRLAIDGLGIAAGEAVASSTGGCPNVIMGRPGYETLVLHAARNSLLDRTAIVSLKKSAGRRHFSVCDAGLDRLGVKTKADAAHVWVKVLWSISAREFAHPLEDPVHRKFNKTLWQWAALEWGEMAEECVKIYDKDLLIDLPQIIRAQCILRGVPHDQIDLADGFLPGRGFWKEGTPGAGRNLVVVARHS